MVPSPDLTTIEEIKNAKATLGSMALHYFITVTYLHMEWTQTQQKKAKKFFGV
jgi:hypothetical protein